MFELRYYQSEAINAVLDYCKAIIGNPLIVLPTATGKSLVIAGLAEAVHQLKPNMQILILAHRKELIEQNAAKINGDVGIYHAGIGRKETDNAIIVAGIQSLANNLSALKNVGLIIVDECDLISPDEDTQYRRLIKHYNVRVIGLTATPYRLDGGLIYVGDNAMFDQIVYEKTIKEMLDEGYICPLISKVSNLPDLSNVKIKMGDYIISQLEAAMINPELIQKSVESILKHTANRKKCLVFSPSIKHANIIKELLPDCGITTGSMSIIERESVLKGFGDSTLKYMVNVNVLTVGYDEPAIDCVIMMRPTKSTRLYVQMCGRSLRLHPEKKDSLILDYSGNIAEHGALDRLQVHYNPKTEKAEAEKYEFKVCPVCESINELDNEECYECGYILKEVRSINHYEEPVDSDILHQHKEPEWFDVNNVYYSRHKGKKGKKDTLKVEYGCGLVSYSQWLCVEHDGWAQKKAYDVLNARKITPLSITLENNQFSYIKSNEMAIYFAESAIDAIAEHHEQLFIKPSRIKVDLNNHFPEIKDFDFTAKSIEKPTLADEMEW